MIIIAKYSNTVEWNLRTTLDNAGLSKLQAEISKTQEVLHRFSSEQIISDRAASDAIGKINQVQKALTTSFNSNLGMLDLSKFSKQISNIGIENLSTAFRTAGAAGTATFNSLIGEIGKVDTSMKTVSKTTDKVFNTLGNTARWGLIASGFQTIMNSAHDAVDYVKELDRSLNDIMIVSDYNAQQMREFSLQANEAAKALGNTTVAYTDASLIYAQQGYNLEDSKQLADLTIKVANTTAQSTAEVSEQMTSWINGYGLGLNEIESTLDKVTKVAAVGASDTEELMTAASKVASTASTLGVETDQLISQMSTIISVTREAPENVGNSLKTIYARLGDLQLGKELDDGTTLGNVSSTLDKLGVQVLDVNGNMRDMGDIIEDLMAVWDDFDTGTKQAAAVKLAGKFQYNRLMALLENEEMYKDTLQESMDSEGFLERTQDIYSQGIAASLNSLQAAGEGLISTLFNPDDMKPFLGALTEAISLLTKFLDSVGGTQTALLGLGSIATKVFSKSIANGINNMITNKEANNQRKINADEAQQILKDKGLQDSIRTQGQSNLVGFMEDNEHRILQMSTEMQERYNKAIDKTVNALNAETVAQEELNVRLEQTNTIHRLLGSDRDVATFNDDGTVNSSSMQDTLHPDNKVTLEMVDSVWTELQVLENMTFNIQDAFDDIERGVKKGETATEHFSEAVKTAELEMKRLANSPISDRTFAGIKEGQKALEKLKQELAEGTINEEEFIREAEKLKVVLTEAASAYDTQTRSKKEVLQGMFQSSAEVNKSSDKFAAARDARKGQEEANQQFTGSVDRAEELTAITNATAAVGQLAFAWQGFQNLGSIWANADMDSGEKLMSTMMNLTMIIPGFISAFVEMENIAKKPGLTNLAQRLEVYSASSLKAAANTRILAGSLQAEDGASKKASLSSTMTAAKFGILGTGATVASAGVKALNAALKALSGPIGMAVSLVVGGLMAAFSAWSASAKEAYDSQKELASSSLEEYSNVQSSIDNWKTLREQYETTGSGIEELNKASEELIATLGLQGQEADIAAGKFNNLQTAIEEAQDTARQKAIADAETFINGSNEDSRKGNFLGIGNASAKSDLRAAMGDGVKSEQYISDGDSDAQAIGKAKSFISDLNKQIADIDKELKNVNISDEEKSRLETVRKGLKKRVATVSEALNAEDIADYAANLDQAAKLSVEDLNIGSGASYQEIVDAYFNDSTIGDNLEAMGSWSEQLSWMIQNTTNEAVKNKLLLEQGKESLQENVSAQVEGMDENDLRVAGITNKEEYTKNVTDSYMQQLSDKGLTEKEQIEFIGKLDKNATLEQIQNEIDSIDPTQMPKLAFEPTLTDRSTFSEDKIDSLLEDTGMSQGAFQRMSSDIYNDSPISDTASSIKDEISSLQEQRKALQDSGQATDQLDEKIGSLRQRYENLGETSKDIAAYNLQMNKGISKLSSSWEDLGSVLEDDAAKGTSDYYQALGELDEIMSDILNIDVGALSSDFYENADAIDAMGRAAEGDASAIDDLRVLASKNLVMNLDLQNISSEDAGYLINKELLPMMDNMQSFLDGKPLGTEVSVDDTPFLGKLNNLLAAGQMTAEQATNILSSIGMDADIELKTETVNEEIIENIPNVKTGDDGFPEIGDPPFKEVRGNVNKLITIPTIKGATYTGAGVQTVGGKSGGGGKKSGGGGGKGGGGSKASKPKKKDPIEEEIDRYERVNTLLKAIENDFDKIANEKDRLTGFDVADNMNEEIDLLEKQIALHKEKLAIQKDEAKELQGELAGFGITFDEEGFIKNYADIHRKLEAEVNNLINQYNATSSEEGQESLEEKIEAAEKRLDKFKDKYQRYDELFAGDMKETLQSIEDLQDSIEDLRIEALKTAVEAADNIKDIQESLIDFNDIFSGLGSDDPFRAMGNSAQKLGKYFDVATSSVNDFYDTLIARTKEQLNNPELTDAYRDYLNQQVELMEKAKLESGDGNMQVYGTGYLDMALTNLGTIMKEIEDFQANGESGIFGKNSADLYEVGKEIFDQAVGLLQDYEGEVDNLRDAILDAIDEIGEKLEDRLDEYEAINDSLEHQASLIEMLRGETSYDELNNALAAQQNNYKGQINLVQQQLLLWQDLQGSMEKGSEEWKAIQEQIVDTQDKLNELIEESLENLQKQYENTVNKTLDAWSSSPFDDDLDWIAEEWELINRNADYYLDQTNAAYAIQKLQGRYLELLDGSNDLAVQQQITDQMREQLAYLREKKNISEYDVAYANAQLEILQKRIALEEAQRNKSQMKLKRDSQGNYLYRYVAKDDDVKDKENDLLDAQNNAYNLSKEQMKQTQADSLSALQDAKSMLNDIWNDANLTLEEKQKRTKTITDSLKEYLEGTSEQLSTSEKNIINDFLGMVEMMNDENTERLKDVYDEIVGGNNDAFDAIDTRWSDSLTNWLQNLDEFNTSTDQMFDDLIDNANNYQGSIDEIGDLVQTDFNDMSDSIQNATDKTNDLNAATSDFLNQLKNDAGTIKQYEANLQEYTNKIKDAENAMKAYQVQVNELSDKLTAKEQENANLTQQVAQLKDKNLWYESGGTQGTGPGGAAGAKAGSIVGYKGSYYENSWGEGRSGSWYSGQSGKVRISSFSGSPYGSGKNQGSYKVHLETLGGGHLGWVKPSQLFDSGGYTGQWNGSGTREARDGKLAWLHQKELVLNSSDTENILAAVEAVRSITDVFKQSLVNGVSGRLGIQSPGMAETSSQTVEQRVEITAEFPGVTEAIEIKKALESISDNSFQYAKRER